MAPDPRADHRRAAAPVRRGLTPPGSDTAAVLLTLGEETTPRALQTVRDQTLQPAETVRISGVRPFFRAFNQAAATVSTPFFVQVDADMVLDRGCFQALRGAMTSKVGIAVGALRDPLAGRVAGVKIFRAECFKGLALRDTLAPEIDFYTRLAGRGWMTACLTTPPTVGAHLPAYTLEYVYGTYFLLGARYAARDDAAGLAWRVRGLRRSSHELAPVARMALGHGVFADVSGDAPKPDPSQADAEFLRDLAHAPDDGGPAGELSRLLGSRSLAVEFRRRGASLRAEPAARLRGWLRSLAESEHPNALAAETALAHGALGG